MRPTGDLPFGQIGIESLERKCVGGNSRSVLVVAVIFADNLDVGFSVRPCEQFSRELELGFAGEPVMNEYALDFIHAQNDRHFGVDGI